MNHCPERKKPGGCQLHNLQCGYPACDTELPPRDAAAPSAPAPAPDIVSYQTDSTMRKLEVWSHSDSNLEAYAAAREAAAVERVRGVLEADAMRFRWLTEDHADPETRAKCRELLSRMAVMSYSAACTDIDSAMAQATKREMLRTAIEWRREKLKRLGAEWLAKQIDKAKEPQ